MSVISRKQAYDKMVQESAVSWWRLYQEESAKNVALQRLMRDKNEELIEEATKRLEAEEKYERLTRKIKENAIKEVAERDIEPNGKLQKVADWNDDPRTITNQDRDYFEAILEMARDEGEWLEK